MKWSGFEINKNTHVHKWIYADLTTRYLHVQPNVASRSYLTQYVIKKNKQIINNYPQKYIIRWCMQKLVFCSSKCILIISSGAQMQGVQIHELSNVDWGMTLIKERTWK